MTNSWFPYVAALVAASALWQLALWANRTLALRRTAHATLAEGARVGVLVACPGAWQHVHHGFLTGFTRPCPGEGAPGAEVAKALRAALEARGLVCVDLRPSDLPLAPDTRLVWPWLGRWRVSDEATLRHLRERLGLSAFVVAHDAWVTVAWACAGESGGWQAVKGEGSGLHTFGFNEAHAVLAQDWHVYTLDPPSDLALAGPLRKLMRLPSVPARRPADLRQPTAQELADVRQQVVGLAWQAASAAAAVLETVRAQHLPGATHVHE